MSGRTLVRWSGYVAVAILFAILCVFLSNWQFTRGAERDAQLALIAANYDADPVPLADLLPADADFDAADQWRPVILTGRYLTDDTLLARNRAHGGTSAFEVLVPLLTTEGRIVMVDRGWVPPGGDSPEPDAVPAPADGEVTVVARLQPGEPLPRSGRTAPDGQVPTIHLPLIADTLATEGVTGEVITDVYALMVSEDPAATMTPHRLEAPSEDPGPHLSYAIQWILFAIMGFVFIWYMIRTERRHRKDDGEDDTPASARPPRRRAPRRDRDSAEEDAILDAVGR